MKTDWNGEQFKPDSEKNTNPTKTINNSYSYYITVMNSTMYKLLINL